MPTVTLDQFLHATANWPLLGMGLGLLGLSFYIKPGPKKKRNERAIRIWGSVLLLIYVIVTAFGLEF